MPDQPTHCGVDHGFGGFDPGFVVPNEAAMAGHPAEDSCGWPSCSTWSQAVAALRVFHFTAEARFDEQLPETCPRAMIALRTSAVSFTRRDKDHPMRPDAESAIVDALYRGACDEGELMRAIDKIATAFDCPSLLLGDLDNLHPEKTSLIGAGMMDSVRIDQYKTLAHLDYATPLLARLAPGTAGLTYRLFDEAESRRHVFYDAFIEPLAIGHALASPLHVSGSRLAMIALHQVKGRRVLGDDDVAALERLTPHVARVLHARRAFLDLRNRQATYAAIVDASQTGLMGLARDGSVLFVNPAMRALAAQGDGLLLDREGLLTLADRKAARSVSRLQTDVSRGGAGGYVRVLRPSRRIPFVVSVSRLPVHDEELPPGGILFAVVDPDRRQVPHEARIAALLGLTPGSAKVVQALLSGDDLKTYAEKVGLGVSTVRTHLKAAFARTETHSQTELVRLTLAILSEFDQLGL